jgi:multiple sugar transport system substrate-binding protein
VFQDAEYEDRVCNGLEYIWSHGGEMVDDYQNPTRVVINSPETVSGLAMEWSMIEDGVSPPDVADYTELETFEEFLSGRAVFCRIVPTYYALIGGPRSPLSREQVEVTPIPAGTGGQSAGCLGGWNLHINAASDKQEEA